jgi:ribose/xylose/arabinose/galactoside ABC-type transport system permease subunit
MTNTDVAQVPASNATRVWGFVRTRLTLGRYTGVILGLFAVCVYMTITEPLFLTGANWSNILRSEAVILILAIGMTYVVLTGGIDLSIGSITAASAVALGIAVEHGGSWWVGTLAAIAAGLVFGFANGFVIGVFRIPFFVVTLGTLSIYQSIALLETTQGQTISLFNYTRFEKLSTLVNGNVGPIPTVFIICVVLYLVASFVLRYMTFGRAIYAVGANQEAARLSGISVTLVLVSVYTISGLAAGLGAAVQAGRLGASAPQADPTLMLSVVAAVLIGGTSLTGGDGGLFGTFLGALFLGVIQNALQLGDVSAFYQGLVSGLILILAVGLGVLREHAAKVRQRATRRRLSTASASEEPSA